MNKPTLKVILVDDEDHAMDLFENVLNLFPNNVSVIARASNLPDTLELLKIMEPDVLFMDIEMPQYSGIEIAEYISEDRNFEIVFVTAHSQYAIPAFKVTAFDYLLKPIDKVMLKNCIERLNVKIGTQKTKELPERLALASQKGTRFVDMNEILYLQASAMYSDVYLENERITVSRPLGEIEPSLNEQFIRIHRSHIVNCRSIVEVDSIDGYHVILKDGTRLAVSRSRREALQIFLKVHNQYILKSKQTKLPL